MSDTLLPPNATPFEEALEASVSRDLTFFNQAAWDPRACPAALLPWLAHSLSVDVWEGSWPESTRRDVIAASVAVHRRKGTRAAIREALAAAGFPGAIIVEGSDPQNHDGTFAHDGSRTHGSGASWADYSIFVQQPITTGQASQVRRILSATAPARCRLLTLNFVVASALHDGAILHDGTYTHGAT